MGRAEQARQRYKAARAAGEERLGRARESVPAVNAGFHWFERERLSGAALLAGGLAYRFFFWLVAFGLVLAAVGGFWAHEDPESLENAAKSTGLAGVAAHSATSALASGNHTHWYFLIVGSFLMSYFGFGAVKALRIAGFIAWRLEPSRTANPAKASAAFSGFAALGLGLGAAIPALGDVGVLELTAIYAFAFALNTALFAVSFYVLPRAEGTGWQAVLPGALLGAAGVCASHVLVTHYLAAKLSRSPELYGAFGAATVVLVWLFLAGRLVVAGMFLNSTLWFRRNGTEPPSISPGQGDSAVRTPA
jgi:uncharacterized BrkB/YihY/UPF0761 family membrane protein